MQLIVCVFCNICMNLIIHVYFILYIYINTQKCYNNNNNKTLIPKFLSWLWIFDILTRMSHMYSFSPFYFIWNHTFYSFFINMPFFTTFIYIYIYILTAMKYLLSSCWEQQQDERRLSTIGIGIICDSVIPFVIEHR